MESKEVYKKYSLMWWHENNFVLKIKDFKLDEKTNHTNQLKQVGKMYDGIIKTIKEKLQD